MSPSDKLSLAMLQIAPLKLSMFSSASGLHGPGPCLNSEQRLGTQNSWVVALGEWRKEVLQACLRSSAQNVRLLTPCILHSCSNKEPPWSNSRTR